MRLSKLRKTVLALVGAMMLQAVPALAADAQLERIEVYPAEVRLAVTGTGPTNRRDICRRIHQDLTRVAAISTANAEVVTVQGTVASSLRPMVRRA